MISIAGPFSSGVAAGGAGTSTANQDTPVQLSGEVHGIYVQYNGTVPAATADVTIATKGTSPHMPATTLLTLTNAATSGMFYPRKQACDTAGSVIAGVYDEIAIDDYINIAIAQTDATTSVTVWIILERYGD